MTTPVDNFEQKLDEIIKTAKQTARLDFLRERVEALNDELTRVHAEILEMKPL